MHVAMNLLNLLSECMFVSCDYILHYYVCGYEFVREVVNYYNTITRSMSSCTNIRFDWVSYESVCFCFVFRRLFVFDTYSFELVRFRYPVSLYLFSCSTILFSILFLY